jgi:hypothetical protein
MSRHARHPLHRIEIYNSRRYALAGILSVQLRTLSIYQPTQHGIKEYGLHHPSRC